MPRTAVALVALLSLRAPSFPLRAAQSPRVSPSRVAVVWIAAGEFTMGASADALVYGVDLCDREPDARDRDGAGMCQNPIAPREVSVCHASTDSPQCGPVDSRGRAVRCPSERLVHELGAHTVLLGSFGVDRTEVTVGAYTRCISAGACSAADVQLGMPQLGAREQPVVGVSWFDAARYCAWVHGRLPSEAEWERVARGSNARIFPWGNQWDPRRANHGSVDSTRARAGLPGCIDERDGYALTAPVGSYPDGASPEGVLDLAGNAWEWTADLWDEPLHWTDSESRYPVSPDPARVPRRVSPTGASHGAERVVRGGGYDSAGFTLRVTYRGALPSGARALSVGFRCAYDPRGGDALGEVR